METKKARHGSSCAAKYCSNKPKNTLGISYFRMPKDAERCSKWIEYCSPERINKNTFVRNIRICSEHFEDKMFLNANKRNRLTDFAVPTLSKDDILAKRKSESNNSVKYINKRTYRYVLVSNSSLVNNASDTYCLTPDHSYYSTHQKSKQKQEPKHTRIEVQEQKIRNTIKTEQT